MNYPNLIIGAILALLGRKLFWLFVGGLGFLAGYTYTEAFLGPQPDYIVVLVGVVAGAAGALLAVFLQGLAVGVAGFLAGGFIALETLQVTGFDAGQFTWLACFGGGILGTVLLVFVFDWALIVLSTVIGGALVVETLPMDPEYRIWSFLGIVVVGCAVQAKLMEVGPEGENRRRRRLR
jgi:hypothetical protein